MHAKMQKTLHFCRKTYWHGKSRIKRRDVDDLSGIVFFLLYLPANSKKRRKRWRNRKDITNSVVS